MRLFVFFGSLLVIALLAALIGPRYVDWNQFKNRFETQASRVLGQKVTVEGQTSATLLPAPSVTFTNVRVGTTPSGEPLMTAQSFRMNVELASLLKGDVVVTDINLVSPRLDVMLDKDGKIFWPEQTVDAPQTVNVGGREIPLPKIDLNEVALENITVFDGTVRFRDERVGRDETLSNINGSAAARSLAGPWRGNAYLNRGDERFSVRGTTGRFQEDGRMTARLSLQPQSSPYNFDLDGPVSFNGKQPRFEGKLRIRPMAKQSSAERIEFARPDSSSALPIRLEADLNLASGGASVPAFKLDIGSVADPYIVTGTAQALFGQSTSLRVRAEGQQINVDRLEKAVDAQPSKDKNAGLLNRLEALRSVLVRLPRLELDSEVSLFLPAVVAGDTVIREVGVDIRPADSTENGWQLRNLEAQLPGRTELRANGVLSVGEELGYQGDMVVASSQPSGLAAWLGAGDDATVRDLRNAGFSADIDISSKNAQFEKLEIILDGQTLKGSLQRNLPNATGQSGGDAKPAVKAKLEGDVVNLDQLTAVFGLFAGGDTATTFGSHNLDLEINAQRLQAFGALANDVKTRFSLEDDALAIRQLDIGNLRGAAITLQGAFTGVPAKPKGRLTGLISSENAAELLSFAHQRFPETQWAKSGALKHLFADASLMEDTKLQINLDADGAAYEIGAKGDIAKSELDFSLRGDDLSKALDVQNLTARLVLVNENASIVMSQLALPIVPLIKLERGAFRMTAEGVPKRGMKVDTALTLREGYLSASGIVASETVDGKTGPSGSLNVLAEAQDLDPFILISGLPIPGYGNGDTAKLSAQLKLNGSKYSLEEMKSQLGDISVEGGLALDALKRPRPILSGSLKMDSANAETVAALVYVRGSSGSTNQNAAATEVGPLLSGLDASIEFQSDAFILPATSATSGPVKLSDFSSHIIVRDGDMTFDEIDARWGRGQVKGTVALAQSNAAQLANGRLSLTNGKLVDLTSIAGFAPVFQGGYDLNFAFETSGVDKTAMVKQLTGSGTFKPNNVVLQGIGPDGFQNLLRSADATEDAELSDKTPNLVRVNMFKGTVSLDGDAIDFSVASGVLRANTISLTGDALKVDANARLALDDRTTVIESNITFDAGRERVAGATPEISVRFSGKPDELTRSTDANLMSTYLGMRVSERREREFEAQQAAILERQRLQRSAQIYRLEAQARQIAAEEAERLKQLKLEQEERRKREEARRKREEIERQRLEAEIKQAEEQAKREALLEAGRRAEREKRIQELRKQAEEAARRFRQPLDEAVPAN